MKKFLSLSSIFLLIPLFVYAQPYTGDTTRQLDRLIEKIITYAQTAITFLMLLATIYFIIAVIRLIMNKDANKLKEHKDQVIWSIIGLALMVTVWGLIRFAANTLGIREDAQFNLPCPPGTSQMSDGTRKVCR